MKNFLLILLISIASSIFGQDTLTYFVARNGKETAKENAVGYRKVVKTTEGTFNVKDFFMDGKFQMTGAYLTDSLRKKTGLFKEYLKSGALKSKKTYKNGKENGNSITYHKSGNVKFSIDYILGEMHGKVITYWQNGIQKRDDNYHNGVFINGKCYNESGTEIDHFPYMILPKLPGGKNAMNEYLSKNVIYPARAKLSGIDGKVIVNFTVGKMGKLRNIRIVREAHPYLNKEALRVVNAMPTWIPGKQDGEAISVSYNLPIDFKFQDLNEGIFGPNPRSITSYNKATKFFVKQEFKKAIKFYTDAISWYPEYTKAYLNRAISYARMRDIDNACKDWKMAADLGNKDVQNNIDNYCK